jgi:hypothetical protein
MNLTRGLTMLREYLCGGETPTVFVNADFKEIL